MGPVNVYREYLTFHNYETLKYSRKSRADDPLLTVEENLEKHDRLLDEYAVKHLGGSIPPQNEYREIGSGERIDKRPEMLRLLKAIESPAIKAILVVDVQRLSRGDLEDAGRLIRLLRYTNTCVITPMKTYDLRDEYDRDAFERELKRGNEYLEYYKKIQTRGKLASVREGNYLGSVAPFGFSRTTVQVDTRKCPTLMEKKDEADIVRLIFHWYCEEDIGVTNICRRLENMKIKTKQGKGRWEPSIIFSMLENVHYIGCVRWNWRQTIKIIEEQEIKELRPKAKVNEYLIFNGRHNGIVSEELFEKAKQIRGSRHRAKSDTTLKNPLSGVMFCKTCGCGIGYNTYKHKGVEFAQPKLRCNNQVRCKSGSADFHEVMEYIITALKDCRDDFKVMITNDQDDSAKLHEKLIKNLKVKLKALEEKEIEQWEAQYHPDQDQRMPSHIFKQLNEKLLKEKEEINQALCKAYESMPKPVDYKEKAAFFTEVVDHLERPNVSAKIKNRYLKDVVERIEYFRPPTVRITKQNAHLYNAELTKGTHYHTEPYKISITLRS